MFINASVYILILNLLHEYLVRFKVYGSILTSSLYTLPLQTLCGVTISLGCDINTLVTFGVPLPFSDGNISKVSNQHLSKLQYLISRNHEPPSCLKYFGTTIKLASSLTD